AIVTPLGNVRTVELRGLGPDVQANIAPTTLNFGNVGLLVPSEPRSFELTNTGTIPLEVIDLKDFMLPRGYSAESNCPSRLSAGDSCTYWITFKPEASGYLQHTVAAPVSMDPPMTLSMSGTGQNGAPQLSPNALDF